MKFLHTAGKIRREISDAVQQQQHFIFFFEMNEIGAKINCLWFFLENWTALCISKWFILIRCLTYVCTPHNQDLLI